MVRGGVAVANPSETIPIRGVTIETDETGTGLPAGTFMLSSPAGRVAYRELGTLNPGDIKDINWIASTDNFYYQAVLGEADADGVFTATFPDGVSESNITAWISEVDYFGSGALRKISYDPETNTGIFSTNNKDGEGNYILPLNQIPKYIKETEFNFNIRIKGSALEGEETTVYTCDIPVLVRYLPAVSYLDNEDGEISRMTSEYKGLFAGTTVKDSKSFSRSFISKFTDIVNEPERIGDALSDFGFAQDVSIEKQSTRLNFSLKNPSADSFMQNISIVLKVADGMPDKDGVTGNSARIITGLAEPKIIIKKDVSGGAITFDEESGILTVEELAPNEEMAVDFLIMPPEGLNSCFNDMLSYFDEYDDLFEDIELGIAEIYSWLEYSFDISSTSISGGLGSTVEESFSGITAVRKQEVAPAPKVYLSYELTPAYLEDSYIL